MADNIEMKSVNSERGGGGHSNEPVLEAQTRGADLVDLPDAGEPDLKKGQLAATTTTTPVTAVEEQHKQNDVSPLTIPGPEATEATAPQHKKKKKGLISKIRFFAKSKVYVIGTVVIVALIAAAIALGVIVSKDNKMIHTLENPKVILRSDGYLDGFSGVIDHPLQHLAKHGVAVNADSTSSSDPCDGDTTSAIAPLTTADATTTFAFATYIVNKTLTVTALANSTLMISAAATSSNSFTVQPSATITITSSTMEPGIVASASVVAPSTTFETCLEWGDGAGPCTRPYGSPNSTPDSVLSVMSVAAVSSEPSSTSSSAAVDATTGVDILSMSPSATISTPSLASAGVDTATSLLDALSATSSSVCAFGTATVFVTITTTPTTIGSGSTTQTMIDTDTDLFTSTIQASSTLVTMTETLPWANSTTSTSPATTFSEVVTVLNGSLTTLSVPSFTITLKSTVSFNGTAVTTNTAASYTTGAATTTTAAVYSGGDKVIGKPLGASGGHGNTGNGLYCVVMLVSILTVLLL